MQRTDARGDPVERAIAALRLASGFDVNANWRHALSTAYSSLPNESVSIHGQPIASGELWARACEQAVSEPGFTLGLPRDFCKYVAGIVNRCRLQGVWPNEYAGKEPARPSGSVSVPMSQAEREAIDKAYARQQRAKEAVR